MAPSIDGNESPGPSRGRGAGDDRDGSRKAAISAERSAENGLDEMKVYKCIQLYD